MDAIGWLAYWTALYNGWPLAGLRVMC